MDLPFLMKNKKYWVTLFIALATQQGCSPQRDINCDVDGQFVKEQKKCVHDYIPNNKSLCACDNLKFKSIGNIRLTGSQDRRGITIAESKIFRLTSMGIDFSYGNFVGSSIVNSNFKNSKITQANLNGVKIERSNFYSVDFSKSYIRGAHFYRTDMRHCSLLGADLTDTQFLLTKLGNCKFDSQTRLPFSKDVAIRMGMLEVKGQ